MIPRHIRLTSHPGGTGEGGVPVRWGAPSPELRGPVVASPAKHRHRNAIGSYSGSYAVYRALAVATGALAPDHRPDLTDTAPVAVIGPWPQWADPKKIVSLDPYGHLVGEVFAEQIARRHRRPADDRGDRGAYQPAGNPPAHRLRRYRPGRRRRAARAARSGSPRPRSTRCGTCPASPSGSASPSPNCAAACSRKPAACSRSW